MSLATSWAGIMAPSGETVTVSFFAMNSFCSSPASQSAGVRFLNDGTVEVRGHGCNGSFVFEQNFLSVGGFAGAADDFEIRCAPDIGLTPTSGDSTDVFLPLTSNRQWSWDGFAEFDSGSWVMFVREIADPSGNFDFADYDFDIEDGS